MSQEEGKREIVFQMTMSAARQMLEKELISEDDYKQFDIGGYDECKVGSYPYSNNLLFSMVLTFLYTDSLI